MAEISRGILDCENGFWPTAANTGRKRVPNSARMLSRNMWFLGAGLTKSAHGLGPAIAGQVGNNQLYLTGSQIGSLLAGSVVPFRGGLFLFAGNGPVRLDGTFIGNATAVPQANSTNNDPTKSFPLGLQAPDAPTISAGASGINAGSFAVVITRVRTVSGGESIGSMPSAPLTVKNTKIKVKFPAVTPNVFQDRWGVYVTNKGRGSTGPFFFLQDVDETTVAASATREVEFEWYDSQLGALEPPTDYLPPPVNNNVNPPTFMATLGPVAMVLNSYLGNGVAAGVSPSIANKIDAFNPLATSFLNPFETMIGFAARSTDGEMIVWTRNSLQALVLTGSSSFPILPRAIWPTTGIQSPHGGCFAESIFYGYAGKAGPVRLGGDDPDTTFAKAVVEFMRNEGWDPATVVVGYDRVRNAVVYMASGTSGALAVPFMRDEGIWSEPIVLPGTPTACVSVDGQLKVAIGGSLYDWEAGTGLPWSIYYAWQDEPDPADRKTVTGFIASVNTGSAQLQLDLLLDLNDTPVADVPGFPVTQKSTGSGDRTTDWQPVNQLCKQYTMKASGTGMDHKVDYVEMSVIHEPGLRNVT